MPSRFPRRITFGDVFEIPLSDGGRGYGQHVFNRIAAFYAIRVDRGSPSLTAAEVVQAPIAFRVEVLSEKLCGREWPTVGNAAPPPEALAPLRTWRTTAPGYFFLAETGPGLSGDERRVPEEEIEGLESGGFLWGRENAGPRLEKFFRGEASPLVKIGRVGASWPQAAGNSAHPTTPTPSPRGRTALARAQHHYARIMTKKHEDGSTSPAGSLLFGELIRQMVHDPKVASLHLSERIQVPLPAAPWPWAIHRLQLDHDRHGYVHVLGGELVTVYAFAGRRHLSVEAVVALPIAFRARCSSFPSDWLGSPKRGRFGEPAPEGLSPARFKRQDTSGTILVYDWDFDPDRNHLESERPAGSPTHVDGRLEEEPCGVDLLAKRLLVSLAKT